MGAMIHIVYFVLFIEFCLCMNNTTPEECVLYQLTGTAEEERSPPIVFDTQLTVGVSVSGAFWNSKLILTSLPTNNTCDLLMVDKVVAVTCLKGSAVSTHVEWPREVLQVDDLTELWLRLGDPSHLPSDSGSDDDLFLVGKRGWYRGHLLVSSSGLKPPLQFQWERPAIENQGIQYYYNCVTGCLKEKKVIPTPGLPTVFLRADEDLENLVVSYALQNLGSVSLYANLTLEELGGPSGMSWRNITVVWDTVQNSLGVLVDGEPAGSLETYRPLRKKDQVEVELSGGGFLSACDPRFQLIQGDAKEYVIDAPSTDVEDVARAATFDAPSASSSSSNTTDINEILLVSTVMLLIVLFALIVGFGVVYARTSSKLRTLELSSGEGAVVSSGLLKRTSSSVKSRKSNSEAKGDVSSGDPADDECRSTSDATVAISDVTATPVATPQAKSSLECPRSSKVVSMSEFLDIDIV